MLTYFSFLVIFVFSGIVLFALLNLFAERHRRGLKCLLSGSNPYLIIGVLMVLAFSYTTPWDNYLVASNVWFYDTDLVMGVIIGWVPIEEYIFFLVQTLMSGLLFTILARYIPLCEESLTKSTWIHIIPAVMLVVAWIASLYYFLIGWKAGTYLTLILVWALPPIIIQLFYGADILKRHWRLVLVAVLTPSLYLSAADYIAISQGIWTINLSSSTAILVGGVLAIEEVVFFFVTNTLVVFGMTLSLDQDSRIRGLKLLKLIRGI